MSMGGCEKGKDRSPPAPHCPPWPTGVKNCDPNLMSQAYCIQLCLQWSPTFIFSSTAYGKECW